MDQRFRLGLWTVVLLLLPDTALADSIARPPLWSLTNQAELIVVARVARTEDLPEDEEHGSRAIAHLQVLETLKGPEQEGPERDRVDVLFRPLLICPEPPRYAEGETVVAFLDTNRWDVTPDQLRQLWSQAKLELSIPEVPPRATFTTGC